MVSEVRGEMTNLLKRLVLASILLVAGIGQAYAQIGTVVPNPFFYALDPTTGAIVNGAKLCTYAAGTTTPLATYSNSNLSTPNTNPVIADSSGKMLVYLSAATYKFTLLQPGTDNTCST